MGTQTQTPATQRLTAPLKMAFPIMQGQQTSTPFSAAGVTPLQRALYQAQQNGEDTSGFAASPVTQQGAQRTYVALNFKILKEIKTATAQYGHPHGLPMRLPPL